MEALQKDTGVEPRNGASSISLSDVKARRTPVEWFEAIAVIQELCRALMDASVTAEHASFGPDDVVIDPAGTVRVSPDRDGGESIVRQVGELLHLALAEGPFPVPLRLVITQSTSTPPFYTSISELSSALEYFERPDRRGLVRALYERARTLPVVEPSAENPVQPQQNKPEQQKQKKKPAKEKAARRPLPKSLIYGAAAAVALIGIGAGAVAWSPARLKHPAPVAEPEKETTKKTSAHGKSVSKSTSVDSAAVVKSTRAESMKGTVDPTFLSPVHRRDAGLETAAMLAPVDESPSEAASDRSVHVTSESYGFPGEAQPVGATIYSASDRDVTPPLATYPRLPVAPPDGISPAAVSTLELLVSETGEVESVRLKGEPAQLADALLATMNLSAAKAWRFAPAVKDGRPVRYRKMVHVWRAAP